MTRYQHRTRHASAECSRCGRKSTTLTRWRGERLCRGCLCPDAPYESEEFRYLPTCALEFVPAPLW